MSSVGKFISSMASASLEASLGLVQFSSDFTIQGSVPLEAFRPIRQALSPLRRQDAEYGSAHRTARKLAWLFQQVIPDTPELLTAYGTRVHEILKEPGINPSGTVLDGPFRDYIGADITSLWAAATSGTPAYGVHLLSCMLARAWDAKKSTAIWVEIVEARKAEVLEAFPHPRNFSDTTIAAALQEFSREELAKLDMSARAWLAQADKAREFQRDQFLLIVKNVSLQTGSTRSTYQNIIETWTSAMECLEKHLNGVSQQVNDGFILYAISSWHLFPDLVVFGSSPCNVCFHDPLFANKPARLTLGLNEIATYKGNQGPHWSLALSHLRFYGDPVRVESIEDRSRVNVSQFQILVLGAVLSAWDIDESDWRDAIRWVSGLWTYLEESPPRDASPIALKAPTSWLCTLAEAANSILTSEGQLFRTYEDCLNHGASRMEVFLTNGIIDPQQMQPYFGLCNPSVMESLSEPLDIDAGITFLRQLALQMGLKDGDAIIKYSELRDRYCYEEYATVIPHEHQGKQHYARWIPYAVTRARKHTVGSICDHPCHSIAGTRLGRMDEVDLESRMSSIKSREEYCFRFNESAFSFNSEQNLVWTSAPKIFNGTSVCCSSSAGLDLNLNYSCFETDEWNGQEYETVFVEWNSTKSRWSPFQLFIKDGALAGSSTIFNDRYFFRSHSQSVSPADGLEWLQSSSPSKIRIWDYIQFISRVRSRSPLIMKEEAIVPGGLDWDYSHGRAADMIFDLISSPPPLSWLTSLELVGVIVDIYKTLPGATISIDAVAYPVLEAYWTNISKSLAASTEGEPRGIGELLELMDREHTLACIAMMQTGNSNLEPHNFAEVIAISSDNSIFVPSIFLSDPCKHPLGREVRHLVGNVGFPGLNLMHPPSGKPSIRPPRNEIATQYGRTYNYEREDKFEGSSFHLRFTGQRMPIVLTDRDNVDQGIYYLQSVVSLLDTKGQHVADLNLLGIEKDLVYRIPYIYCMCEQPMTRSRDARIMAIDSWQDLLKPRRGRKSMVRAHKNWSARLAALTLLVQQDKGHAVGVLDESPICWKCLEAFFDFPEPHFPEILID
ncbi:hypothetical protein F5884DRAFT_668371 [Xylogone sp. PMI_703]|nr:hypothetical protein F5884DRAFT_668371 [Xylogone sp. PMI_703]